MKGAVYIVSPALALLSTFGMPDASCLAKEAPAAADAVSIRRAVDRGAAYVKEKQRKDGSWDGDGPDGGVTAIAVYALLKADCPLGDPAVARGIDSVLGSPWPAHPARASTYAVSLTAMALETAIERAMVKDAAETNINIAACRERLRVAAEWLVAAQHRCRAEGGTVRGARTAKATNIEVRLNPGGNGYDLRPFHAVDGGAWGYGLADSNYVDNSNTQFALLGLRAAQNVGDRSSDTNIAIPREVWIKALARLASGQASSGEWDYGTLALGTKGFQETMTAAGISGLIVCMSSLLHGPDIGKVGQTPEIVKALAKLERYVYPPPNTVRIDSSGVRQANRTGYMLYSLERACMLAGLKELGAHDWYGDGAAELLRSQQSDGSWSGEAWYNAPDSRHRAPKYRDNTIETTFCILFLTKAFVHTQAQKNYTPAR